MRQSWDWWEQRLGAIRRREKRQNRTAYLISMAEHMEGDGRKALFDSFSEQEQDAGWLAVNQELRLDMLRADGTIRKVPASNGVAQ